jgi:multidrug efflux pump subunit AcrA (membrane-fusion protein)
LSFLDPAVLQELLRHLDGTDVVEAEIEVGGSRVVVRRDPGYSALPLPARSGDSDTASRSVAVVAPLTGVFYSRPSPEQPPFVTVGEIIQPGHVVALIETMKLFNEVVSEIGGEVTDIAVLDHALVEAGQALVYVDPVSTIGEETA